ncbi:uncharacterized protein LOC133325122 [Musca vetustissima]|uniref:uncharacterized protein LOC133325122 n=1 Tax=Musca vetustissima TaxID=27455 RepID=UPI002AB6BD8D|nr:uncharacterized protein LOC133325122 [Musca vetustissima]
MQLNYSSKLAFIATILFCCGTIITEARRVTLRPLKPDEVYRILKEAGREDAIPEGRVVTQAISAISGFGVGVASGVGGAIIYDLITQPNETMAWLNGLFGMNGGSSSGSSQTPSTQEICFKTRSMDYGDDENIAGRQMATTSPTSSSPTGTSPTAMSPTGTSPTTMPTTDVGSDTTCIVVQKGGARHRKRREAILQQLEERYKDLI